jgi:hypothetical protein
VAVLVASIAIPRMGSVRTPKPKLVVTPEMLQASNATKALVNLSQQLWMAGQYKDAANALLTAQLQASRSYGMLDQQPGLPNNKDVVTEAEQSRLKAEGCYESKDYQEAIFHYLRSITTYTDACNLAVK